MGILSWFTRRRLDEKDLEAEIRAHLAIAREERVADGADPRDAQYEALREFGNVTLTTEAVRGVWTPRWLESLRGCAADVRYAMRARARNPAFSLTVVGVLTLGPACSHLRRNQGRPPGARVVSRLPVPARSRPRLLGALRHRGRQGQHRQGTRRPPGLGGAGHGQLLPAAGRACPVGPPAVAVRRDRAGPAAGCRAQRWSLAEAVRRRSGHRRQDSRDQQPWLLAPPAPPSSGTSSGEG